MLRLAAKESIKCRVGSIREASQSAAEGVKKSGGVGKKLFALTAVGTGVVGGTLGYAYVDTEFRKTVEDTIPQSKQLFDATIGPPTRNAFVSTPIVEKLGHSVSEVKQKVSEMAHKVVPEKKELPPPKPRPEIVPVDVHKPVLPPSTKKPTSEETVRATKEIEKNVISALEKTQKVVKDATDAKIKTIEAVTNHAKAIKEAVDAGSNANWDKVREALAYAENLANKDLELEAKSRNALDGLKKVISSGKHDAAAASAPILVNARDTADKLSYQIDELNQMIQNARNESRVFNQYKDLIDKSRQRFAEELKAVVPNVDIHAKQKKLTEEELNALIAHAHLKVDQLKRQLTEQQLLEEKNIAKALEEQRKSDANLSKAQLELELTRVQAISNVELEKKLRDEKSNWEKQLEERLQRAAAAHADNLEQVIRTQKQLHDIENAQAVDEAVEKERRLHQKQVELALEKLRGIETALESRVALDAENRRSKQFWLACQNLHESIAFGQKSGETVDARRKPLEKELSVIGKACENDEFVKTLITIFPSESLQKGVYTEADLKLRFKQVYKIGFRLASIDENGGSLAKYISSWIQSLFIVDFPRRFSPEDPLDLKTLDNREVLARVNFFVQQNDLLSAVRVAQLLEGPAARVAQDWIQDTRQHLEVKFLADLLLSHAAVSSIRSVY
ncbi:unnamed protein product [Bursaphelenchus xylophilus]|uniref:MICOS complex subunit MIC60 n=1 Tax=Bursaphelenchus xylophilus TaxID=6326 RepID=A0A1I7SQ02_BURXY|nr:unnamed protein product [Bursaphelenchus xylophilus]CAG9109432.1 unnamed protein product [Bursaphelenchus xylophilus]